MSDFGNDLIKSMQDALAHARGERDDLVTHTIADDIAPADVRARLKLTQDQMALLMGMSTSGYRKWEQGKRSPSGAARTLLRVMEQEPEAVARVIL